MISLTDYALELYQQPEVQGCCLFLQDEYGIDVPYALFLCWYGACVGDLPETLGSKTLAHSQSLSQQVIRPLRAARRWMKEGWQAQSELRERIKAPELKAELALLKELEAMAVPWIEQSTASGSQQSIRNNLCGYGGLFAPAIPDARWQALLSFAPQLPASV